MDLEELKRLDGLFVGMLDDEEMDAFERGIKEGLCHRSYEGSAGFLGLAKVRVARSRVEAIRRGK